ncbi:MAG: protein kinase [Burkholderiales bacterium]|nr:protein kinase [Burkholderiales bacterium]
MLQTIGRFHVEKLLGEGGQGKVYLARDPHLGRQVAIKVLAIDSGFEGLLDEARIVAKLRHPNIVTLFDAGEHDGEPYLVFEYVEGMTLAQEIKKNGALPEFKAAGIALGILEGLSYAHGQNVIHRDIKPANIMIEREGVPRIMDFGIAQNASSPMLAPVLLGSPLYMAPEYISKKCSGPQSDIFSMGMVLYDMLTGQHPVSGKSAEDIMRSIASRPVQPPSSMNAALDERLDSIVMKALAIDPENRYRDAESLIAELKAYLEPSVVKAEGKQSTLDFLLRRIRHKSDFPALSQAISAVNKIVAADRESISNLSNVILRDFSLTNKLIKLVNAATYGQFGGAISTISRAIVILGFDTVRSVAVTLMLFEHLQNKSQAAKLKDEIISTFFSGVLAREMAPKGSNAEEGVICAMFYNLGRLLAAFYFPEEVAEIGKLLERMSEEAAAVSVLGITYEELGVGIAQSWHFPDRIVSSMRKITEEKIREPESEFGKLRVLTNLSNELRQIAQSGNSGEKSQKLHELATRYHDAMPVSEKMLGRAIEESMKKFMIETKILGLNSRDSIFLKNVNQWSGGHAGDTKSVEEEFQKTIKVDNALEPAKQDAGSMLAAGIQDITNVMIEEYDLNDLLRMILETIYRSMDFSRVLLCIKDAKQNVMAGRFGFGQGAEAVAKQFRFPLSGPADVFLVALKEGLDIFISDIDAENIRGRIPTWYRTGIDAKSFILFPIIVDKKPIGMLYADQIEANRLKIDAKELSLLKTMRNQAVLAIKQKL